MRTTIDTHTGKQFRWNTTAYHILKDGRHICVPARCTTRDFVHLHPSRTPTKLLAELNPDHGCQWQTVEAT